MVTHTNMATLTGTLYGDLDISGNRTCFCSIIVISQAYSVNRLVTTDSHAHSYCNCSIYNVNTELFLVNYIPESVLEMSYFLIPNQLGCWVTRVDLRVEITGGAVGA